MTRRHLAVAPRHRAASRTPGPPPPDRSREQAGEAGVPSADGERRAGARLYAGVGPDGEGPDGDGPVAGGPGPAVRRGSGPVSR
ncbi:hypothetical protein GCM10018789_16140 [Streptomyces werraensis]|nr:hypothetical protein GCM10018789_16140 [Streptomyces werraensis]